MTTTQGRTVASSERSLLRSVALPAEHGGWGLTLEPGLLGLMIAPSLAGLCLAAAAMVAFLARTPLKLAAVDHRRGRELDRTRLARRVAAAELMVLALLVAGALVLGEPRFWIPGLAAAPLLAVEAWFDVRSRGRHLVPELAGAVGVASVSAMVLLAGGASIALAIGGWAVLAARSCTSIPHVRAQIARLRGKPREARAVASGDIAALALASVAAVLDAGLVAGALAVVAIVVLQRLEVHRPVPPPKVIGLRQMAVGFGLVLITALGALVTT